MGENIPNGQVQVQKMHLVWNFDVFARLNTSAFRVPEISCLCKLIFGILKVPFGRLLREPIQKSNEIESPLLPRPNYLLQIVGSYVLTLLPKLLQNLVGISNTHWLFHYNIGHRYFLRPLLFAIVGIRLCMVNGFSHGRTQRTA